jgi:cellulose synthase/poly-beta-1,6-N-acetylglucosamine synthase-like glycosyltransferase
MKYRIFMYLKERKFEWLFVFIFFHYVDNEIIVSFKFFQPKIIHLYIYVWNFKRNPVETPKEISHFPLLAWSQIWMTFYFNFFHSVEKEKIVSFKFFRPKITNLFVLGWNFKRNLVETPKRNAALSCSWRVANLNDFLF